MLVTNNAVEFRGRYRQLELHPGVVFLLPSLRRPEQLRLFEAAPDTLVEGADLVNRALDVTLGSEQDVVVTAYDLP